MKQAFTTHETIAGLLAALKYYADPDNIYNCTDDIEFRGETIFGPGRRARAAIAKYGAIVETLKPSQTSVDVGDVQIKNDRREIHIIIDGVEQKGLQSVTFEASADHPAVIKLTRTVHPKGQK